MEVAELSKDYGDLVALHPLDLASTPARPSRSIGHNGSGKSTLLRMVAGLLEPSDGDIEVAGWPVGSLEARATTSFLPDDPVLYDDLSVREHVEYVSRLHGGDGLGRLRRGASSSGSGSWTGSTTCRRGSAAACARRPRSCSASCGRSRCCWSTSRSSASTRAAARRCSSCSTRCSADGAAVVVATHEPAFVERVDRSIALRDGEVIFDGVASAADVLSLVGA